MHAAWVSKLTVDETKLNSRGKPKVKQQRMQPGLRGVKDNDRFIVQWKEPSGRKKTEQVAATGRKGKRLADERAQQIMSQLTLEQYQSKSNENWDDFCEEFAQSITDKSWGTQAAYSETLRLFKEICRPNLVREIEAKDVDDFAKKLRQRRGSKRGSTSSPATVNKHLRQLRVALNKAHRWKYLPEKIVFEMDKEPKKRPVYILPEHIELIYSGCQYARYPVDRHYSAETWWRTLMITGLMTGMRIREMLFLEWDDVHLDDSYLLARHDKSKNGADAEIPLHAVAVRHLKQIQDTGLLVFDWPFQYVTLLDEWRRIQAESGIHLPCRGEHVHTDACHVYGFHALKKSCGTLNAARMPQRVLNAFMRHSSQAVTAQYYQDRQVIIDGAERDMYVPEAAKQSP